MNNNPWWIKKRQNPQTGTYYVAMGQMYKTTAKRFEKPLYGNNIMLQFDSRDAYATELKRLRQSGERIY